MTPDPLGLRDPWPWAPGGNQKNVQKNPEKKSKEALRVWVKDVKAAKAALRGVGKDARAAKAASRGHRVNKVDEHTEQDNKELVRLVEERRRW